MKLLLLTPPMTQLNTPYPATAYLTGFLRAQGYSTDQRDPAIELVLRLFSHQGLGAIREHLDTDCGSDYVDGFCQSFALYQQTVEPVIRFLQGKDPSLALRIAGRNFLPEGPSFAAVEQWEEMGDADLEWAFGNLGVQDKAKYFASLYLDDLAFVVQHGVDPKFSLSRYGERLAASVDSFDPLEAALEGEPTLVDKMLDELTEDILKTSAPDVLGLSVPFPGNLYGALRIARIAKRHNPDIRVTIGGGYVNTELRELSEPRLFRYVDYVTLDDGEQPLLSVLEHIANKRPTESLMRTFTAVGNKVVYHHDENAKDVPHNDTGTPTYQGLDLSLYLSVFEMLNPMHRIWSDGRWNKMTLAHGCYWSRCSFCDITLDYIQRYQEADVTTLITRMEAMIAETGQSGFHFVDEAAPPKVLFALAKRIIEKGLIVTWWANIRFEKSFTPAMAKLLADAGCIGVTGGLEVASNRLLKLMQKGVTVEQVARVTRAFSEAGVLVHAYLMYGFPTQTAEETIDALERVRQLFLLGCIQSAYWHRFAATVHSPVGKDPAAYGVKIVPRRPDAFSKNDLDFQDPVGCDHDMLGRGLNKALYNYMLGIGFDEPLTFWFEQPVSLPQVPENYLAEVLGEA